jgi:hypothetical protein
MAEDETVRDSLERDRIAHTRVFVGRQGRS